MRQNYHIEISPVTDYGPKDSNFPQNAWGLLDGTAHDHIFGVIPGNSDAIMTQNVKKLLRKTSHTQTVLFSSSAVSGLTSKGGTDTLEFIYDFIKNKWGSRN